jgi:hypothetical protein
MISLYPTWSEQAALLKEEGVEEGRESVARNMLACGENFEKIATYTGLPKEIIARLGVEAKDA